MAPRPYKYATAIHEAGHAVIGRALRMVCGPATIKADHDSGGHAVTADPWLILGHWWGNSPGEGVRLHGEMESVFRGRILTFMAGWAAEVEIVGRCRGGDGDDRYQIALMLEQLPIPDEDGAVERYEARLRKRSLGLVRRHRTAIERVAAELIRRRTLAADEIDALCEQGTP